MSDRSLIIIGAGLAGLAAGCYAQVNGYRTRIYEQHTRVGGVCTAWKRKGYTFDGCLHWLMGAQPGDAFYRLYQEVGALEGNRLIYIDRLARFVDQGSGQCLEITSDLDRLAADMAALSPADRALADELVSCVRAFQGFPIVVEHPAELAGPLDGLKQMWHVRRWLTYLGRYDTSVAAFAERFQSPFLRWAVANVFVPEMPLFFLFILLGQLACGQLAAVEGGSLEFALAIGRRYRALGGEVVYGAQVDEILVEADRAVGVRLADGTAHRADAVISAADGYSTIYHMLGGRYVDNAIRQRYETWPLFRPLLMVSLGVARTYPGLPTDTMLRLRQPLSVAGAEVGNVLCRVFNLDPTLAPPGKTVVQALLETDFDFWYALQRDRLRYEAEKGRVAADAIDELEAYLPGLAAYVEAVDVATPYTLWRYTRNHRGAYEGWLMTARMNRPLPKTLPGLAGFAMAGQWVEPGGGVPPALYSGRQAVQLFCHHDKRPFRTP